MPKGDDQGVRVVSLNERIRGDTMEWSIQDLGALGEFVGSVAVLATLVYVALQIRQTNENARANVEG